MHDLKHCIIYEFPFTPRYTCITLYTTLHMHHLIHCIIYEFPYTPHYICGTLCTALHMHCLIHALYMNLLNTALYMHHLIHCIVYVSTYTVCFIYITLIHFVAYTSVSRIALCLIVQLDLTFSPRTRHFLQFILIVTSLMKTNNKVPPFR